MTSMLHETSPVKSARRVDPAKIATEYSGWIGCAETIGHFKPAYCVGVVGKSLPELIADAFKEAVRFVSIGHKPRLQDLVQQCATCHGAGDVPILLKSGRYTRKPCKACKSQGVFERFEPIDLVIGATAVVANSCIINRD